MNDHKRKQINTRLPLDTSRDLKALQVYFGGIPVTSVLQIAVRRLASAELNQNQTASPDSAEKAV